MTSEELNAKHARVQEETNELRSREQQAQAEISNILKVCRSHDDNISTGRDRFETASYVFFYFERTAPRFESTYSSFELVPCLPNVSQSGSSAASQPAYEHNAHKTRPARGRQENRIEAPTGYGSTKRAVDA